jgi:hypothetical protein
MRRVLCGDELLDGFSSLYEYNQDTGEFVRLRQSGNAKPGLMRLCVRPDGYLIVPFKDRCYLAHRVAWLLFYKKWPDNYIDHINRIKTDNRIENLRDCTQFVNMANAGTYKTNKVGLKGVHARRGGWMAQITVNKKHHFLGDYKTKEEAHAAYQSASMRLR